MPTCTLALRGQCKPRSSERDWAHSDTTDDATSNEALDVVRCRLDDAADDPKVARENDAALASDLVGEPRREKRAAERACRSGTIVRTEWGGGGGKGASGGRTCRHGRDDSSLEVRRRVLELGQVRRVVQLTAHRNQVASDCEARVQTGEHAARGGGQRGDDDAHMSPARVGRAPTMYCCA